MIAVGDFTVVESQRYNARSKVWPDRPDTVWLGLPSKEGLPDRNGVRKKLGEVGSVGGFR